MYRSKEIIVGIVLTLLLAVLFTFVHNRSVREEAGQRFTLYAKFSKSDGIMPGSEVRLAGMRVGAVNEQTLVDSYLVSAQMVFDEYQAIPLDSSVTIETDGLLGAKHIEILPGGDIDMMKSGDTFSYAQDALILTELLDKVNAYMRDKKDPEKNSAKENVQ